MIDGEKSIAPLAPKSIEDIKIGDWVLSDDPNTPGGIEYKQVLQTFNHDTTSLVDIYIGGEKITTTNTHPFWVQDVGWVAARDLDAGTHLQTKTESWLAIDKVETHTGLTTVYNFEVAGFHTYFVSDIGLLVHNNCSKNAKILRENMEAAGETFGAGDQAHHITPALDGRTQAAKDARDTLNGFGIPSNDAANGVKIPISQHQQQGLHRGTTYEKINTELKQANSKAEAEGILQDLAARIQAGTFP
jgi:hypothetical protein